MVGRKHVARGLIVFEGLDATGKTHLSRELAAGMAAPVVRTPCDEYAPVTRGVSRPEESLLVHLGACARAWHDHETSGRAVTIVDRFWFSSAVAFGCATSLPIARFPELVEWILSILPMPALTILLVSDRDARLRRLAGRPVVQPHEDSAHFERYWREAADSLVPRDDFIVVPTTSDDTEPVLQFIKEILAPRLSA